MGVKDKASLKSLFNRLEYVYLNVTENHDTRYKELRKLLALVGGIDEGNGLACAILCKAALRQLWQAFNTLPIERKDDRGAHGPSCVVSAQDGDDLLLAAHLPRERLTRGYSVDACLYIVLSAVHCVQTFSWDVRCLCTRRPLCDDWTSTPCLASQDFLELAVEAATLGCQRGSILCGAMLVVLGHSTSGGATIHAQCAC